MSAPSQPPPPQPKKSSFLVNLLARLFIIGDKLGPFRRPLIIVGAILLVFLLLGFVPRWRQNRRLASESRSETNSMPSVTVTKVERSPSNVTLTLPGNIEAVQQTQLNARTTGYVRRYLVDIGDRVQAGQVLAEIDTPEVDQDAQQADAELARAQATLAQSTAQLAQQGAALQTSRANAARANADLSRAGQSAEQTRAQLRQARANAELARVTWRRWASLVAGGAISRQEADEKEASYNSSLANVASLEAALRASNADTIAYQEAYKAAQSEVGAARENVNAYRAAVTAARAGVAAAQSNIARFRVLDAFRFVRAPYAGVITARGVDEGALVGSNGNTGAGDASSSGPAPPGSGSARTGNSGLFTLARLDALRIYVDVPQTDASAVRAGQSAKVSVRELPKRSFDGLIRRTSNALDQTTRTLRAEVLLANQSGTLLPGMYAQVRFDVPRPNPPVLIPASALISDARGNRVAAVSEDKIAFHTVEIGRDFGESLEITDGLRVGERVVTNPSDDLKEGIRVKSISLNASKKEGGASGNSSGTQGKESKGGGSEEGGAKQSDTKQSESKQDPAGQNAEGGQKPASPNATAKAQIVKQGGESNEPRAQPGGAAREAAQQQAQKKRTQNARKIPQPTP